MVKLQQTAGGGEVYVHPQGVTAVEEVNADACKVHTEYGGAFEVEGSAKDVAAKFKTGK